MLYQVHKNTLIAYENSHIFSILCITYRIKCCRRRCNQEVCAKYVYSWDDSLYSMFLQH